MLIYENTSKLKLPTTKKGAVPHLHPKGWSLRAVKELKAKKFIDDLMSKGQYFFHFDDFQKNFSSSPEATWGMLRRLKIKKEIVSPLHGYFLIVPREYKNLGTLPPEHFIHDLMESLDTPYYVGLLSAAQRYGASHQQAQVFQVMTSKSRRDINVGRVSVSFTVKKHVQKTPTRQFNTPKGIVLYSSPEATAIDLVTFPSQSGGLGNVLTILIELVEQMTLEAFEFALKKCKTTTVLQRLGYLFELADASEFADTLELFLQSRQLHRITLDVHNPSKKGKFYKRWKLVANSQIESDL